MKKYKLIREYPNSPKLGTIVLHNDTNFFSVSFKYECEMYPEFWEEVKDYEIMSFRHGGTIFNYKPEEDNEYLWRNNAGSWSWSSLPDDAEILSIKRLSDGEVFTVGDTVKHKKGAKFIIKCIRIYEGHLQLTSGLGIVASISDIEHFKEMLFVTEDGKEIYDKFEVFYKVIIPSMLYRITQYSVEGDRVREQVDCKYFSTKEAAEKWIDENKPIYSKKNVMDIIRKSRPRKGLDGNHHIIVEELLENFNLNEKDL